MGSSMPTVLELGLSESKWLIWLFTTVGHNGVITYIEIFSPKKNGFSPVEKTSQIF